MYARKILASLSAIATHRANADVQTQLHSVPSEHLQTEVPVSVLLPPGYKRDDSLPLLISLDGGIGDRNTLINRKTLYAEMFSAGILPPLIVVSFSGGPNQFYHGDWEGWVLSDLVDWAHRTLGTKRGRDHLLLAGISGGGYGTLKIGFKNSHRFRAIAAMEPTIMPSLEWPEPHTRASWWLPVQTAEAIWGSPFDPERFLADHPANIAHSNADQIRESGIEIYLEAGDEDLLNLHDGAEFLHRQLWDLDIRHEFHQVRWANHGGQSIDDRIIESHAFLASALMGGTSESTSSTLTEGEQAFVDYVLAGGPQRGEPPPANASQGNPERALTVMARLYKPLKDLASKKDPAMIRAYGYIPERD